MSNLLKVGRFHYKHRRPVLAGLRWRTGLAEQVYHPVHFRCLCPNQQRNVSPPEKPTVLAIRVTR